MTSVSPYSTSNITLFTPDQISALTLWLDAADSSTIQLSDANVTQWNDKSRNGYNCISNSNYVGTSLPTYSNLTSQKYVNFADNQALVTSNWNYSSAWSCFVALNSVVLGERWLISPFNGVSLVMMGMNQGINKIFNPNVGGLTGSPADITGRHIEYTSAENTNAISNLLWYRDGTLQASNFKSLSVPSGTTKMGIGANATFANSMAGTYQLYEVLIYNKYLSATERVQVESYLAYKWNLQTNLPTTHPYSRTPYNTYYGLTIPYVNLTNNLSRFPSEIPGLNLWLDASDSSTVITNGNAVTRWNDKSGSNNSATQVTSLNQPTYSNTFINFNGTNSFLNVNLDFLTGATHNSFIVLRNFNFTNIYGALTSALSNRSLHVGFASGSQYRINYWANDFQPPITSNYRANQINLLNFQWVNNTSKSAFANAVLEGTSNQPGIIGTMAGGGSIGGVVTQGTQPQTFLSAYIYEIMIYTGILTVAQRQQIEAYLVYKWNLQSFLPSNHPAYIQPLPVPVPRNIQNYNMSPLQYAGCVLWLDALDSSTVGLSGVNITSLRDKSSNAYLFSNSTGFTYNVNKFNGTYPSFFSSSATSGRHLGSNVSINFTQPLSVFVVCSKLTDANGAYLFDGVVEANRIAYYSARGRAFAGSEIGSGTNIISSPCVITVNYNTTNSITLLNGTQYSSGSVGTRSLATGLTLGSRYTVTESWDGHICEMIFYNSILTERQRQQIEGYLAWKWNTQRSLPTNHRFYNFPPG